MGIRPLKEALDDGAREADREAHDEGRAVIR
jgi:hypothetical protein